MLEIRCRTSVKEIEAFLKKAEKHIMDCMEQALVKLCKECDERARQNDGGWKNRTGNLRSSIGGAVYKSGAVAYMTEFAQVLEGSKGSAEGRRMAQSLASQYSDAIAMVILAGMDYAEKVEAVDSKDVLESTRIYAESVVRRRLEEARDKAINDINGWSL